MSLSIGLSSKKTKESVDKFNSLLISLMLVALSFQFALNDTKSDNFKGIFFFLNASLAIFSVFFEHTASKIPLDFNFFKNF